MNYIVSYRVTAIPMSRLQYNTLRGWQVPATENPDDAGVLVRRAATATEAEQVNWLPEAVFNAIAQPTL